MEEAAAGDRGGRGGASRQLDAAGDWDGSQNDLVALYSLVVLKDLGLDPASKEAHEMVDRVDKGACV